MTEVAVPKRVRHKFTWIEMLISSIISLTASLVLSIDAWKLAGNPDTELGCNISATISCGKVAEAWQSTLLGFPNAFLGLMAEPVVITLAVASLAGVVFPKLLIRLALYVYGIGFGFAYWLFYQSYFNIGALCPWCLTVTVTTTTVFITMFRVAVLDDVILQGKRTKVFGEKVKTALGYNADSAVAAILIAVIVSAILSKYL
ncbi:MAG: hypothetical protein RL038_1023 [Actinomycetota bacterium]|jgi:uncharacterized membrane protein